MPMVNKNCSQYSVMLIVLLNSTFFWIQCIFTVSLLNLDKVEDKASWPLQIKHPHQTQNPGYNPVM